MLFVCILAACDSLTMAVYLDPDTLQAVSTGLFELLTDAI